MATGGEVQGEHPGSVGSEDLDQLKCQPCLEKGNMHEAVGMCIDCQDYLCSQCFKVHTIPKPLINHQLLDKEQMLQSQIRASPKDICTEKCSVHEDKTIEYYCTTHCLLGCTVCITLGHAICKDVKYIPHEAKTLANNEEYSMVESRLKSAVEAFENVAKNVQKNATELGATCNEALEKIKDYRRKVEEAFDKIEAKIVKEARAIKTKEIQELAAIGDKYKQAHEEVQAVVAKIDALRKSNLNCSLYTEMMRTKDKLKSMDAQIKEAEVDKSNRKFKIKFTPNQGTLASLQNSETFGILSVSDKEVKVNRYKDAIISAKHAYDIKLKTETDIKTSTITGLVVLPDGRLVIVDYSNIKIKTVNVENGQVVSERKLSSNPRDVTAINHNQVAVTMPVKNKIAIVSLGSNNLSIDRSFTVSGTCCGVAYKNDKLAVSFLNPHKVQVLNLQGTVLYTISADKQGQTLFNLPQNITFGQDDTTLYVSNHGSSNIVCVKLDGTVVATYTDKDLEGPEKPVVDSHGNVYMCAYNSHQVHQISKDCKKIQVLLTEADGLNYPYSICLSEEEDKLYVGMGNNGNVKVYTTERKTQ